jgi:hypothetical protein
MSAGIFPLPFEAVAKIADALEVSLDYLVGEGINSKLDKQALKRLQDLELLEDDKKKTPCSGRDILLTNDSSYLASLKHQRGP